MSGPEKPVLPSPLELREQSRRFREAAGRTTDAAAKRQLAAHAATLAQIAETLARDGKAPRSQTAERFRRLLAAALGEKVRQIVEESLGQAQPAREPHDRIRAWRLRAEELRVTADGFVVPSAQEALRRAAANYDRLADQAEALLEGRPPAADEQAG